MALPTTISLTYNGVEFGNTKVVNTSSRNQYDPSGRTVIFVVISLTVKAKVVFGAAQDATMAATRVALERPGGALSYTGSGFGGLSINVGAGSRDLQWGPKPQVLNWKPVVGDQAAEITWQVEVAILNCANAPFKGKVMAATYKVTYVTDKGGFGTRTHTGFIQIPMTRAGVNVGAIPDTVDSYFEVWIPDLLPGWERTVTRTPDESKSKLEFTVVDTQRGGNPLPEGCVDAGASEKITSQTKGLFVKWLCDIAAWYELEDGRPRQLSFEFFKSLLKDRVARQRAAGQLFVMPIGMSIGDPEIYGRRSGEFSIQLMLSWPGAGGNAKPTFNWFPTAGLWQPIPGSNWNRWSISMSNGARHSRGLARLIDPKDIIVDLCLNNGNGLPVDWQDQSPAPQYTTDATKWGEIKQLLGIDDNPPPAATWMYYDCQLIVQPLDHTSFHVPLPSKPLPLNNILRTQSSGFPQTDPPFSMGTQITPKPIVQYGPSSSYYVWLIGRAVRFAYEVPRPTLLTVGGATAVEMNHPDAGCYWSQGLAGWTTHPIYSAQFALRYFVARGDGNGPALLPIMPHPDMQGPLPQR